jgi:hypothetical protein
VLQNDQKMSHANVTDFIPALHKRAEQCGKRVVASLLDSKKWSTVQMSTKLLLAVVAAGLLGTTVLASAQTRYYNWDNNWIGQDPYLYDVAPAGPPTSGGPFVGTFSQGLPYQGYGYYGYGPGYGYGPYYGQNW